MPDFLSWIISLFYNKTILLKSKNGCDFPLQIFVVPYCFFMCCKRRHCRYINLKWFKETQHLFYIVSMSFQSLSTYFNLWNKVIHLRNKAWAKNQLEWHAHQQLMRTILGPIINVKMIVLQVKILLALLQHGMIQDMLYFGAKVELGIQ